MTQRDPTAEELALAERIADDIGRQHSMSFVRWEQIRLAALAAIRETTERAAELATRIYARDAFHFELGAAVAEALRTNSHLKGEAHG